MRKRKSLSPVGKAIWGAEVIEDIISDILVKNAWVGERYSAKRLRGYLAKWRKAVKARGAEEGLALTDQEVFRHFRVSYLRMLSSLRRRKELERRITLAVGRIKKDRLLRKAGVDPNSQDRGARAWRQRALEVIEERFGIWETRLRAAIPGVSDKDLYRYFRQRYLHVAMQRFQRMEIEKGIRNTRNYILKEVGLGELRIDETHPQYERWGRMEFWEFKRKKGKLSRAIEACRGLCLSFPPKSSVNTREYTKYLNAHPKERRPTIQEEMLYKLILYFEGMTWRQLEGIKKMHLSGGSWRTVGLDTSLNHLINLKLLGVADPEARPLDRYYVGRKEYLKEKIRDCRNGSLDFASDIDQAELDQYLNWVRDHGENGIGVPERLLLKLISHYGLVSHGELSNLYSKYLSNNGGRTIWSKSTARTYLTKLVDFELVEVIGRNGRVVKGLSLTRVPHEVRYRIHRGFLLN